MRLRLRFHTLNSLTTFTLAGELLVLEVADAGVSVIGFLTAFVLPFVFVFV